MESMPRQRLRTSELERVHEACVEILSDVGSCVSLLVGLTRLDEAGFPTDHDVRITWITSGFLESALDQQPREATLRSQGGNASVYHEVWYRSVGPRRDGGQGWRCPGQVAWSRRDASSDSRWFSTSSRERRAGPQLRAPRNVGVPTVRAFSILDPLELSVR
jgi:hypothetical protein